MFCKALFVICSLYFATVSTFRGCVFSCPDIFFGMKQKSDHIFYMTDEDTKSSIFYADVVIVYIL